MVRPEEEERGEDHPADHTLHGRGGHPGRQEGDHVSGEYQMLWNFQLLEKKIRDRLSSDVRDLISKQVRGRYQY